MCAMEWFCLIRPVAWLFGISSICGFVQRTEGLGTMACCIESYMLWSCMPCCVTCAMALNLTSIWVGNHLEMRKQKGSKPDFSDSTILLYPGCIASAVDAWFWVVKCASQPLIHHDTRTMFLENSRLKNTQRRYAGRENDASQMWGDTV